MSDRDPDPCWAGCGARGFHLCPNSAPVESGIGPKLARLKVLERENAAQRAEIARLTVELDQYRERDRATNPILPEAFMG